MKKLISFLLVTALALVACQPKDECLGEHYVVRNWMDCPRGGDPNSCTMLNELKCAEKCNVRFQDKTAVCVCPKEMCEKK